MFLTCEVCQKQFTDPRIFKKHKMLHAEETPHKCSTCGKFFNSPISLRLHEASQHSDVKEFMCSLCPLGYVRKYLLTRHMFAKHGITHKDLPTCDACGSQFKNLDSLKVHKFVKHGIGEEDVHICDKCGEIYGESYSLKRHMFTIHKVLSGANMHTCNICKEEFIGQRELRQHRLKVHDLKYEIHKCDFCDTEYCNTRALNNHKFSAHGIVHSGLKQCSKCGKKFTNCQGHRNHEKKCKI